MPLKITRVDGEQSNTSVIFGDQMILKFFRLLQPGPNPDYEILRFLNENTTFDRIPVFLGSIEYTKTGSEPLTLGLLETLIPNQGNAWRHTLDEVTRYYERCVALEQVTSEMQLKQRTLTDLIDSEISHDVRDLVGLYLDEASTLGRRTAELHLALASSESDPAFAPEPATTKEVVAFQKGLLRHGEGVFRVLKKNLDKLQEPRRAAAHQVLENEDQLLRRFEALDPKQDYGKRIRVHGDYHLGQVLWVKNDFMIIDFEGEPARPIAERRMKQHALKDVAGMIRSFSYAAYAELVTFSARGRTDYSSLEVWSRLWQHSTASAFVKSYLATAGGASFLPQNRELFVQLLECLLLDKVLYELNYELNNRPDWVWIPLAGILNLL